MFAMLVLAELGWYVPGWPRSVLDGRYDVLARWFSDPEDPSGYGIGQLTNSVRAKDEALANSLVGASNAGMVAGAVSKATAKTAYNLAEMLALTGSTRPDDWTARFRNALDRNAQVELGRQWPQAELIFTYAKLCHALCWTDETLALDMVEAFTPTAQRALAANPVGTFDELYDITWHTLRVLDPLGAYRGKHRPSERGRRLAAGLCAALKPATLSKQLSATGKRDFQQAEYMLLFLAKAAPAKFNQTVAGIDWDQVSATFGEDWSSLYHDAEVFLAVCFRRTEHRAAITALIERNAYRIKVLSPRLALMAPDVAYRHVADGRVLSIAQFDTGAGVLGHFIENGYPLHCPLGTWYACLVDTTRHPVAGLDYPRTFQAMDERFRDDAACREYIRRLRWPQEFTCPHCGEAGEPWVMAGGWLRCRACRKQTSLTAGTIFEGTRKPFADVVSGDVEWGQCARPPEGIGAWQLRNCLDLAAQAAPRHGPAGPGPAVWYDRG